MLSLTINKPHQEEEVILFDRPAEVTVGRSSGSVCCLDFDPLVSRMHAVFMFDPPTVRIKDLNSTNGLAINGTLFGGTAGDRIIQPRQLCDGDVVHIGQTSFRIAHVADGAPPPVIGVFTRGKAAPADEGESEVRTVAGLPTALPEIPGFKLKTVLGIGRLGCVYLAKQLETNRPVALKVLYPEISYTRKMYDDIKNQVAELRAIRHPNIVRLFGAGALGPKNLFLVMEYVNGENLPSYLARCPQRRMEPVPALALATQLCAALCHAEGLGYVQGDFSPGNVLLFEQDGRVEAKVTKVGFAKLLEEAGVASSFTTVPDAASLACLAPEKVSDLFEAKPANDVFSLTSVFYQMITGRIPYDFGPDEEENLAIAAQGRIVPVEERLPGLPETLVVIIDRGLSRNPDDRYANCCAMLEALRTVRI